MLSQKKNKHNCIESHLLACWLKFNVIFFFKWRYWYSLIHSFYKNNEVLQYIRHPSKMPGYPAWSNTREVPALITQLTF